ncbi:glyoxalase [candidate division KSB1 bacterium]|nr:glyoxalase [candidate division KSB1 bacterium]NIR72414.1 glyoxalase [candidate division KSB1 bacterium]NIS26744.1 glyoxalase [candidate division KSB1 bacterium]NIT73491.1 glyoxalase [candidate division KSB1 bacterium]NIU27359.1 glyoxalase [candidate division KSB1 bacterium]
MKISLTSIFVDDPIKAHKFYTEVLGFQTKEFDHHAQVAIVVSAEEPNGTALLLEPRGDSFGKDYQETLYQQGLPVIVFGTTNIEEEKARLKDSGVQFRDDLDKPEWGLQDLFEDSCGNLIMLDEISKT